MTEFQLDVNDFNDIAAAVNKTGLPSYIVHVQAGQEYNFPTPGREFSACGGQMFLRLLKHQKRISGRRGEDKRAIYYKPSAFSRIDTFSDEIRNMGYKKLAAQMAATGPLPFLT